MQIFYDPANGQVMAIYTHPYTGTVWQSRGFLPAECTLPVTRDHRVTVKEGRVTAVEPFENPEKPAPSADELRAQAARDLIEELLASRARDPDAPKTVKDYIAARGR